MLTTITNIVSALHNQSLRYENRKACMFYRFSYLIVLQVPYFRLQYAQYINRFRIIVKTNK